MFIVSSKNRDGLAALLFLLAALTGTLTACESETEACPSGQEGCQCGSAEWCNAGAQCLAGVCVNPAMGQGDGGIMSASGGSSGQGGSGSGRGGASAQGGAGAGNCLSQRCAAELAACGANPSCAALSTCLANCATEACIDACLNNRSASAIELLRAALNCGEQRCPSGVGGAGGSGGAGANGGSNAVGGQGGVSGTGGMNTGGAAVIATGKFCNTLSRGSADTTMSLTVGAGNLAATFVATTGQCSPALGLACGTIQAGSDVAIKLAEGAMSIAEGSFPSIAPNSEWVFVTKIGANGPTVSGGPRPAGETCSNYQLPPAAVTNRSTAGDLLLMARPY